MPKKRVQEDTAKKRKKRKTEDPVTKEKDLEERRFNQAKTSETE